MGQWVTPAFWLPDLNRWVIIREWPDGARRLAAPRERSLWQLAGTTGLTAQQLRRLVVLYGPPLLARTTGEEFAPEAAAEGALPEDVCGYEGVNADGERYYWTECPRCHRVGIERGAEAQRVCRCFPCDTLIPGGASQRLIRAFARAGAADITPRRMSQGLLTSEYRRHCMPN
jgi:hypothetical protein